MHQVQIGCKRIVVLAILVVAAVSQVGCASIICGKRDTVVIDSAPSNMAFSIFNRDGNQVYQGTTPASVILNRGAGFFKKQVYVVSMQGHEKTIPTKLNPWSWGNIVFGGVVGFLIVDPLTGAMWDLPKTFYVDLAGRSRVRQGTRRRQGNLSSDDFRKSIFQ